MGLVGSTSPISVTMDPFTVSMAVAPLILSSAKLIMLVSAVKDSYKTASTTLIATSAECRVMHMTLSKIQGLVYKNESDLSSRLTAQKPLREAFDDALTGCRMTLAALNLEMDKLIEPNMGTQTTGFGFRVKAKLVWKEDIMKQLLDQTRGQMTSLRYLIEFLESETQADILKSLQQNLADIRRIFHRAKSIRLNQGIGDDQSSFHLTNQVAAFGLVPSYEAQLSQSSTYQRAQTAAAEELFAKRIELLDEKYALEDKVEGLLLEIDLKDESVRKLEHDILTKDQAIGILEQNTLNDGLLLSNEEKIDLALLDEYMHLKTNADIIHRAAKKGDSRLINLLLRRGANTEAFNHTGCTPLHVAAQLDRVKILQLLLDKGANIEAADQKGMMPLHYAARDGHVKIVQILLEKGASWDAENEEIQTPLHFAAFYGSVKIAQMLLERGAKMEAVARSGETPLHRAAYRGHVDVVQMLLDQGANREAVEMYGRTPYKVAKKYGHRKVAKLLFQPGDVWTTSPPPDWEYILGYRAGNR